MLQKIGGNKHVIKKFLKIELRELRKMRQIGLSAYIKLYTKAW